MYNIITKNCFTIDLSSANVLFVMLFYIPVYPEPCRICCGEEGSWVENVQSSGVGAGSSALVLAGDTTSWVRSRLGYKSLCPWPHGPGIFSTHHHFLRSSEKAWSRGSSRRPSARLSGLSLTAKGSPVWRAMRTNRALTDPRELWPKPLVYLSSTQSWVMRLI